MKFKAFLLLAAAVGAAGCDRLSNHDATAREWTASVDEVSAEALRAAVKDPEIRRFYESRNWAAAWDKGHTGQLTEAIGQAQRHALDHIAFLPKSAPADGAAREAALTKAALDYAKALSQGVVNPKKLWSVYTVPSPKADLIGDLNSALSQGKLGEWLESLAPQTDEYRALSAAYVEQLKALAAAPKTPIRDGGVIKVGDKDPRVPALVQALQANGYLKEDEKKAADPQLYTKAIATAVTKLQANYGIKDDGVVGPETLEVLNTGPAERVRQLAVNLERRRWLDRNPPATRIDVNTAATFLEYWRDGALRDKRRVVVGQPDWETPELGSPIFQLVANPTWTVPESIEKEEIAAKGPGYLERNNMVRRDGHIVQLPGPDNALGQVKFDMKNDQAIYLHDTPAKALFGVNERHRSHGCIRVDDAVGFAEMLAEDGGIMPEFRQAMAGQDEEFVQLKNEIPVRLLYHTAFLDGSTVRLLTDAYGWDQDVADALHLPKRVRRVLRSQAGDVGP